MTFFANCPLISRSRVCGTSNTVHGLSLVSVSPGECLVSRGQLETVPEMTYSQTDTDAMVVLAPPGTASISAAGVHGADCLSGDDNGVMLVLVSILCGDVELSLVRAR